MESRRLPELCDNSNCTGCSACYNACPADAIKMTPEPTEGFYRPVVDVEKCVRCLKCERSCPIITPLTPNPESKDIYAAWNKNEAVRAASSSGGAFSALADYVLESGGAVIGAAYDENLSLHHILIENQGELSKLRASKYLQSEIGLIYKQAEQILISGRKVLFCGTPCQVAGFKGFLGSKTYNDLILVDFICHGVPSPKFFHRYIKWLEKRYGNISDFYFRSKRRGWYDANRCMSTGATLRYIKGRDDSYWIGFSDNKCLQDACYDCQFLGRNRNSDITISDFWGIGKKIPFGHKDEIEKGVSMIMINTPGGQNLFDIVKDRMAYFRRTIDEVIQGNHAMIHPSSRPASRSTFYPDLDAMSFDVFLRKYLAPDKKTRVVKLFREYMPSCLIQYLRLRDQK